MNLKTGLGIVLLISISGCYNDSSITADLKQIYGEERGGNLTMSEQHVATASRFESEGQMLEISATAKIAGEIVKLEVARTPQQQAMGLMYRQSLASDRGMLFPFESAKVARFWMKNVAIPLDMIFLKDNRVIDIAVNVPPCSREPCLTYGPDTLVDRVIELRGGRTKELGLKTGDTVEIDFFDAP